MQLPKKSIIIDVDLVFYIKKRGLCGKKMEKSFVIEVSARHAHLNKEAVDVLFGKNYALTPKKQLSQPGQYVCEEKIDIIGAKSKIENVSIIGPQRDYVQVEVSQTDARKLGVRAPLRESGDLELSAGCKLVGPEGELEIENGLIVAKRHIHATVEDAKNLGIKDGEIVWVLVESSERRLIFGDVVFRVSPNFLLAMHIDTDEANAAGCWQDSRGKIVKI